MSEEERYQCKSAHSSGSHGAVSSVKLRHFSGKLWSDTDHQERSTLSAIKANKGIASSEEFSQCGKTQCGRRREQLTCPNMNSWKTECL